MISKLKVVGKIVWEFMVVFFKYDKFVILWNVYEMCLLIREVFKKLYVLILKLICDMLIVILDFNGIF